MVFIQLLLSPEYSIQRHLQTAQKWAYFWIRVDPRSCRDFHFSSQIVHVDCACLPYCTPFDRVSSAAEDLDRCAKLNILIYDMTEAKIAFAAR